MKSMRRFKMEKYLDNLKDCHDKIKNGFYNSEAMPTLGEQRELLMIAQTCINLSTQLTNLRKLAEEKSDRA